MMWGAVWVSRSNRFAFNSVQIIVPDEVNRQVAAFDIAQLAQPLFKGSVLGRRAWEPGNDADMEDAGRRLVGIRGRSDKADQQRRGNEPATGHSITPSARARVDCKVGL